MSHFCFFLIAVVLLAQLSFARGIGRPQRIRGICVGKTPSLAKRGDSCGVPAFVDKSIFGANDNTNGILRIAPAAQGVDITIVVKDLPKPDLVLTAWVVWVPPPPLRKPGDEPVPAIFDVR